MWAQAREGSTPSVRTIICRLEMKAKIIDKKEIAEGTLWLKFGLLGKKIDFKPGQFFYIDLINPPYDDEKGSSRHFTIVNSPTDQGIIEMATRIRESAFKRSLAEFKIGTEVEISGPDGNFILPSDTKIPLVFITGGIGITPFMSMLSYIQENKLPYKITILYSNNNQKSAAFLSELKSWVEKNPKIKLILTMTQEPDFEGEKRMIDAEFIKEYISDIDSAIFMLSGPPGMVTAINKELKKLGIDRQNIKTEQFAGY